ncbi:hypothetical protein K437DRAFT_107400 [Tilletiaria anomala UBC 951]|uniref:Uncharacterized protein n=1 Tax=Tilletiaria anomala (strain ATCC 24038 / CBS 436.72 / UBC 951) TaxID=1037660 RepID=A0A066VXL8_TILAU|nr:uncharacterized protein K437DRAFT_107400 [Tilletiaria anomala UBC 951]KDN46452.1 hypothetical protein K437DRAFT_107400 [Tilletiaria anomala UBC 951]
MRIETVCLALLGVQLTRAQQEGPSQADPPAPSSSIYTLLHRVVSPKAQGSAWFPRAKLEIKHYDRSAAPKGDSSLSRGYAHEPQSAPALQAAPTYVHHLENLISQSEWDVLIKENESTDGTLSWYQVTLVEGEPSAAKKPVAGSEGPIAAAKLCQLSTPRAHALTVNLSPTLPPLLSKAESLTLKPYAIKYAVPDLMLDANGCPFASEAGTYAVERAEDSLHVRISTPQKPPV